MSVVKCAIRPRLVSIVTPTFNHEGYIAACIESVLRQSYQCWEQIIIDDGSTDATAEIVARFRDPRIHYCYQTNKGPFELAKTYNQALAVAKGDLIAILEGDDFWPEDKLAKVVAGFQDDRVVMAYGEATDTDATGAAQRRETQSTRRRRALPRSVLYNDPIGSATRHMLLAEERSLISPSTVVIRRSTLEHIGGFQSGPGLPLTDYPTFIELSLQGTFFYLPHTLGFRRRHQNSVSVTYARNIHERVSDFTRGFLARHSGEFSLSETDRHRLEESWKEAEDKLLFSEGRLLLLQEKWADAATSFRLACRSRSLRVKLAALAGLLCSWCHWDVEGLMKLGGRANLRTAL